MRKGKFFKKHFMHKEQHVKKFYGRRTEHGDNKGIKKACVAGEVSEKVRIK